MADGGDRGAAGGWGLGRGHATSLGADRHVAMVAAAHSQTQDGAVKSSGEEGGARG